MEQTNGGRASPAPSSSHLITPLLTPVQEHEQHPWPAFPRNEGAESTGISSHRELLAKAAAQPPTRSRARAGSHPNQHAESTSSFIGDRLQRRSSTTSPSINTSIPRDTEILKLSPTQIKQLTSSPGSLPLRRVPDLPELPKLGTTSHLSDQNQSFAQYVEAIGTEGPAGKDVPRTELRRPSRIEHDYDDSRQYQRRLPDPVYSREHGLEGLRPRLSSRALTTPTTRRASASEQGETSTHKASRMPPSSTSRLGQNANKGAQEQIHNDERVLLEPPPSPMADIPLPPLSMPTYLQLELSQDRPSQLYIHRSRTADIDYEASRIKFDRLMNFLSLPLHLEKVLVFGAFTCLDAWLYVFTILPLRFVSALWTSLQWGSRILVRTSYEGAVFIHQGLARMRKRQAAAGRPARPATPPRRPSLVHSDSRPTASRRESSTQAHEMNRGRKLSTRRYASQQSAQRGLSSTTKADFLTGLLIIISCAILIRFDASRMYHAIRGQAAIKLYVIYNVLEVCDRLFSALGQDILECLFCEDTLSFRRDSKRSILRPIGLFLLALIYCVTHSTALFYQVVTLNVAVNSYSNALLTLLLSNQFVEIKGTVFKKFEKESLFQLTCADVVERFQLWLMLLIIALRNIVELGGLSISFPSAFWSPSTTTVPNATGTLTPPPSNATGAARAFGMIPNSFSILSSIAIPSHILTPVLIVLGSEMLVDWLKHAYITKFNATSPRIYDRFYDVLAKDYYSHAFAEQNLTRRLGLPVIPLACLFIRAALQTYHMFLATNIGSGSPVISTSTSLSVGAEEPSSSPLIAQLNTLFRQALGRSSLGGGGSSSAAMTWWTLDDAIALITMLVFFLALYMVLLAFKLVLGMALLNVARRRYKDFKRRENERVVEIGTKRLGGWGVVEVDEAKRRWIYDDDPTALANLRKKDERGREREREKKDLAKALEGVNRYDMVAKRIW